MSKGHLIYLVVTFDDSYQISRIIFLLGEKEICE